MHINLTWNCRDCVGVCFSVCCVRAYQAFYHYGVNNSQQHFAKKRWVHFLPSILNAIIGTTSHEGVILKMVILHDVRKTIQNGFFPFFLKKEQKPVRFYKTPKTVFFLQKPGGLFKKKQFFSTLLQSAFFNVWFVTVQHQKQFGCREGWKIG